MVAIGHDPGGQVHLPLQQNGGHLTEPGRRPRMKAQLPGAVGQKQAGGAHALELRLEMAEVPAQEDDARGLSLPAEVAYACRL